MKSTTKMLLVALPLCSALTALAALDEIRYTRPDPYTMVGSKNLLTDFAPRNADGSITAVVEIPAGTTAKWEVVKEDGTLHWELEKGEPRIVKYLGYPGNYGMVPRTLLSKAEGGDGDPLDVVVLGPALERGAVVRARVLGMLRMRDRGEKDDKLLAVVEGTALAEAKDLVDLVAKFPGVTSIVETWFRSYKGPGVVEIDGCGDLDEALSLLGSAIAAFEREHAETVK